MTKAELLSRISSTELTEWMGLQTLRNSEEREARSMQGLHRSMKGRRR